LLLVQLLVWTLSWILFCCLLPFFVLIWAWHLVSDSSHVLPKRRTSADLAAAEVRWGKGGYLQLKDVSIHYVEAGDRGKELMLCLHGFPEFWFSWRHQLKEFSSTHWVVAVDMRGYGDSDKPRGIKNYQLDVLVDDVRQMIRALGKDKCVLLAHDWGGVIAWKLVMESPHLVSKFIPMNCPHPGAYRELIRIEKTQLLKSWYILFFQLPVLPELVLMSFNACLWRFMIERPLKKTGINQEDAKVFFQMAKKPSDLTAPINYYRNFIYNNKANDVPIKVPTMIIWGSEDRYLSSSLPALTKKRVDDCSVQFIAGASHWVQQDAPDIVNERIRAYLQ